MLTLPRDIARASQDIHSGPTPSKCTPLLSWADWTFDSRVLGGTKKIAGRKSGFSGSNFVWRVDSFCRYENDFLAILVGPCLWSSAYCGEPQRHGICRGDV
jgi:hypothetical protein